MNQLSIERINEYAPYKVEAEDGQYIFETDNYILYGVSFDEDPMPGSLKAYWFNLTNHSLKASPRDSKIRATVILIIVEFFRCNPYNLLYMRDSTNNQQAQPSCLFLHWFNAYGQQADYYTCTEMVKDGDEENYIALIVKRDHPQLQTIIDVFNKQIEMFRANKP